MPRNNRQNGARGNRAPFQFEWVSWSEQKLDELRAWISNSDNSLEDHLSLLADRGWKVSLSENQQTGRYLVSLTDKWEREGCANRSFGIEHREIAAAISGAVFYATEVIGEGFTGQDNRNVDDLW